MAMKVGEVDGVGTVRYRLLGRRAQLRGELRAHLLAARGVLVDDAPAVDADAGDDALIDLMRDLNLAELERDARELEAIGRAIGRMDSGDYGVCQDCGEAIGQPRLSANPHAVRCIACATRAEHGAHSASL